MRGNHAPRTSNQRTDRSDALTARNALAEACSAAGHSTIRGMNDEYWLMPGNVVGACYAERHPRLVIQPEDPHPSVWFISYGWHCRRLYVFCRWRSTRPIHLWKQSFSLMRIWRCAFRRGLLRLSYGRGFAHAAGNGLFVCGNN